MEAIKVRITKIMSTILKYIVVGLFAMIMLFPFYWMLIGAFKTSNEIYQLPPTFIADFTNFTNFIDAFHVAPFGNYLLNSLVVVVLNTLFSTFLVVLASYGLILMEQKYRTIILSISAILMAIPFELLILVNYETIIKFNLYNTLWALIIPFIANIFYLNILTRRFEQFPKTYFASAQIEGISKWKYLWRILVPNTFSTIAVIILLNAISSWNSFVWPKYVIIDEALRTLPFGLYMFVTETSSKPELIMAASLILITPMILLYIFLKKYIIRGFSNTK